MADYSLESVALSIRYYFSDQCRNRRQRKEVRFLTPPLSAASSRFCTVTAASRVPRLLTDCEILLGNGLDFTRKQVVACVRANFFANKELK